MTKNIIYAFLFAVAIPCQLSKAEVTQQNFTYQLYGYPKSNENCHLAANKLAADFATATGIPASGECKSIRDLSYDIFIHYKATQELAYVSTYPETLLQERIHIFPDMNSCTERLSAEIEHFRLATGLEPWTAFCSVNETYSGIKLWALRIDAFGTPSVKPFWADGFMLGSVDGMSESAAEEMIATNFRKAGVDVRLVNLRNDPQGIRQFSMLYYNPKSLDIGLQVIAFALTNQEQCQAELGLLSTVLPNSWSGSVFCANNYRVQSFEVLGVVELNSWFESKLSVETFPDYSDCVAGRDALLTTYRDTVGLDVATGLCSREGGRWRLNLLMRRH
jgi:hypothetical protein